MLVNSHRVEALILNSHRKVFSGGVEKKLKSNQSTTMTYCFREITKVKQLPIHETFGSEVA